MARSKFCISMKQTIVKEYLSGEGSYKALEEKHGVESRSIREWVWKYQEHGAVYVSGFSLH